MASKVKKTRVTYIVLIILLALKSILGLVGGTVLLSKGSFSDVNFAILIVSILYLISLVAIIKKYSWGAILAVTASGLDLVFGMLIDPKLDLAVIGVILVIVLSVQEYQELK